VRASGGPTPADLSRRYIEAHNAQDLEDLVALLADDIDVKGSEDPRLTSASEVRAQYAGDWSSLAEVFVEVLRLHEWTRPSSRRSRSTPGHRHTSGTAGR